MANKKINQLVTKTSIGTSDLFMIGDASTGQLYKKTIADLQATITGSISGSGSGNYITKFTGTTTIGNSVIYENSGKVNIGTTTGIYKLTVQPYTNLNFGIGYGDWRSEEHTSELQSLRHLVCRLLLEKKKQKIILQEAHRTHLTTNFSSMSP